MAIFTSVPFTQIRT